MADFDTKFKEMQKFLPFLQNVIEKLRNSTEQGDDNPRKAQLKKMEVLHDLLKSNGKKLKMETLLKCEALLIKLHSKMERIPFLQSENETSKPTNQTSNLNNKTTNSNTEVPSEKNTTVCSVDIVDITGPESPPPQPLEEVPPVEIPTERRCSPMPDIKSSRTDRDKHRHTAKNERNHKQHSSHQQPERHHNHTQALNHNRTVEKTKMNTNDPSHIFNRRSVVGTESATDTANKYPFDPLRNRDPRASNAFTHEIYSPEECWDNTSSGKRTVTKANHTAVSTDLASANSLRDQTYHDTIFNFKKTLPKATEMFSRVRNLEQSTAVSNRTASISTPVKVPTLPDVLKSPPLSASDISDLLKESGGKVVPSIAQIGNRRPAKDTVSKNTGTTIQQISAMEAATLDQVRKKFAIVTKRSPQLRDSPDVLKSPLTSSPKDIPTSLPKERIALKYNPHPRTERNTQPIGSNNNSASDTHVAQPTDPRLTHRRLSNAGNNLTAPSTSNALNSATPYDPRLRNVAASSTTSGLYKQTQHPTTLSINTNATDKPPLKQSHIPSLLDVKVTDPRKSFNANFTNTTTDPRQHVVNKIPTNQTQAAIFCRRDFHVKATAPAFERPTVQRSKSGYSSEENWDSEPETPSVTQSPQPTQPIQSFAEPVKARDGHTDAGFRSVKPPLLPTPTFGRPISGNGSKSTHLVNPHFPNIQHSQSVPQYSNSCKFSALLNDKTERSKYFESKKQKQSEPRTYMEHRKAKARAAAEDAARKAAIKTAKAPSKDIGEVSDVNSSVLAKLSEHPPVASTLDKLYRSTDFTSCEFPKAKTSFKIPKKPADKTTEKTVTEPKVIVENKEDVKENNKEPSKDTSTTIQDDKKNTKEKVQEPKKVQEGTSEKQQGKKNNNKESAKKQGVDTKNNSSEKVKKKPVCKGGVQSKPQTTLKTDVAKIQKKCNASEEVVESNTTTTGQEMGNKISQSSAVSSTEQANNTTEPKQTNEIQKTVEDNPILESATDKSDIEKSGAENLVSESAAKDEYNETKSMPTKEVDCKSLSTALFLTKLQGIGKPARILQRRNTMLVRGSLPEVDKEKIFPIKSLVYEDIQGTKEEELRQEIGKMPKMNKSLADMFQKTDDNCKVSTQNIISGKRRTRTNVNFNEVQRSLEIFNHKRRSEPLKQPVEKASPATIKKKVSPKGKKGAKGKAKYDTSVDNTCEEELVKTENIEEMTVAKTEKKTTKRKSAKVIKWDETLEAPKNTEADNEAANTEANEKTVDKKEVEEATTAVVIEKSVKPISRIDTLMDEDAQKRHLLESFVQDILNPKKDKAQIFSLLSQIISEDSLKFVKEIVDSAADKTATQNEEVNEEVAEEENNISPSVEPLNVNNAEEKPAIHANTAAVCAPKLIKGKGKTKKKNELDRLNEDIRTMFISQGVLTATGRRMCTLVAAAEEANKTDVVSDKNTTSYEVANAEVKCKSPAAQAEHEIPIVPRLRKAKVLLKHIDFKEFQKSANTAETVIDYVNADKMPPRKMPILKPHTPIKQSDVEDEANELAERPPAKIIKLDTDVKRVRPGPKCSKKQPIALSSDDEVNDPNDSNDNKAILSTLTATKTKSILKNTNKEWHSQSKWAQWCVLCDIKITQPAIHYMRSHGEFYAARLAPNIMEKLKVGEMNKPYFSVFNKKVTTWFYRCPFCLQYKRMQWQGWLKHLIMHTGEYNFECSKCQRPAAMACQLEYHVKRKCIGATVVRKNVIPFHSELRAHVCHRCHFIQLIRENMDKHFVQQHGIAKTKATKMGFTIVLFDTRDVQLIDNSKTLEFETKIINEGLETIDIVENPTTTETKSKDESIDSDDIPIAITLQCNKDAEAKKIAVEKALSSNIFVPTRETNESPTMNNFAQSLFTITNEQDTVCSTTAAPSSSGISIAERLSQKFKNIQSSKAATTANIDKVLEVPSKIAVAAVERTTRAPSITDESATAISSKKLINCSTLQNQLKSSTETALLTNTIAIVPVHEQQLNSTIETALPINDVSLAPEIEQQLNSSTETALSTINVIKTPLNETSDQVIAALANERIVDSPIEDDDDNWEDIEITESAPSTTSSTISAASSTNNKSVKPKNKNVLHKLNRLYATNNKLKKSLTLTIGSRKREERRDSIASNPLNKENAVRTAVINIDKSNEPQTAELPTTNTTSTDTVTTAAITDTTVTTPCKISPTDTATQSTVALATTTNAMSEKEVITVATAPPNLGFRPLITNLDDLLPDSPCNDPLDLVPELTPMESLQDLCDVSSILNSDYMSDNWLTNTTTSNLNNDNSQQANMQEALDFVKEQQSVQCSVNTLTPLTPLASIQRIQNIGYSKSADDNTYKFYCLSDNCTFLYSSELIGLESHFHCEHAQTTWNGYCHSCKVKVEVGGESTTENRLPLSAELSHMSSKHLIAANAPPSLPIVDDLRQPSKSNSPALDEDRPRIKIRRLTGDCLSTTPTPTTTQSSKNVSTFDENAQLIALTHAEPRLLSTITTSFLNQLPTTVAQQTVENRPFENIGLQTQACLPKLINPSTTKPCQLQIASVVSLQDPQYPNAIAPTAPLPVISNVCSLNSRSVASPVNNVGSLCAQHIVDERTGLERAAAESLEVSRILSSTYANTPTQSNAIATAIRNVNDSPEPQVVAETLPVAQSTSGNYLITQTVSAQYVEGRVGFNISIANNPAVRSSLSDSGSNGSTSSAVVAPTPQFKCMANACKYQTRLPVAMVDHINFHDRQNFSPQREYLRCSQCTFLAEDVDGFIQHTEQKHGMFMHSSTDTNITGSRITNCSPKPTVGNATTNKDNNNRQEQGMPQTFTQETWETALKEIVAATGVPDSKLFCCSVENCKTRLNESTYFSHVVYHLSTLGQKNINNRTYKCSHCNSIYFKPQKIKAHIKTHGVHKYFCYLCTQTAFNVEQMHKHFEERHWRSKKLRSTPLPYKQGSSNTTYYVIYTTLLTKYEIQQFREKLIAEWQRKKSSARTHFKPSEIGLMPLTPIFGKDLNCAICAYKTKVRTNLMRHLQMHTDDTNGGAQPVANVDPVNPVPCLNSSEKHFDKMTNLASSSLVVSTSSTSANSTNAIANGKAKITYDYVPDAKRFTCGVSNCQYLTISDDIFRSHLNALHSDITIYHCPHCKEEICKRGLSVDRILGHLRFHGAKLYVCDSCGYMHYMRTVVERHIRQHDVHPPLFVKVVEYDRTKENAAKIVDNTPTPAGIASPNVAPTETQQSKCKQKWSCNLCGHKTMTQQQIIAHTTAQHSCKNQYQCMHCAFNATQLIQIMSHIDEKHAGKKREARYVYEKLEGKEEEEEDSNNVNTIDTRPLWQRDDPTRVRHIRGILMEDEEESERYRKRLRLDDIDEITENDDGDENINLNQFGLVCYYCSVQCASPKELFEEHWQATVCTKYDAKKPFRFRLGIQLKCAHCLAFVGNSHQLMQHMKAMHKATKYLAADPYVTDDGFMCGHCIYRSHTLLHLAQHTTRMRHKPFDLKTISIAQLEKLKALGAPLSYVHCLSCMELLADQAAYEAHLLARANVCVNNKSEELVNKLIYACPFCAYASLREIIVLRHMIEHYSGFKRCYFCTQPQATFTGYMQHCYSDHREEIKNFCVIFTIHEISKYLQQLLVVFPNGLTFNLNNLRLVESLRDYGNKHIKQLYEEIQKTSQQPPIPRLSLGRLVAKKCSEAKMSTTATKESASVSTAAALQLAGNNVKQLQTAFKAQKIMKRRSTIALGRDEAAITHLAMNSPTVDATTARLFDVKKRKIQHNLDLLPPPTPKCTTTTPATNGVPCAPLSVSDNETLRKAPAEPSSNYDHTPEPIDLSKIFIKINAANTVETKINISKFKLLYNIAPRVVLTPTDMTKYCKPSVVQAKYVKPCPASHKIRYT